MVERMQKKLTKYMVLLFFTAMTVSMLLCSDLSAALALDGLNLWFSKMIPALLPFMILSGLLIRLGLSDTAASFFAPFLRPVFKLSDSCLYCILTGFLCGFPMGARVCALSLSSGKINKKEASLLLAFTNNIGPVYFAGYMLHLFPVKTPAVVWLGMYAVPLVYGIVLRYTLYREIPWTTGKKRLCRVLKTPSAALTACSVSGTNPRTSASVTPHRLLSCLHESILSGLSSITALGGYMIFCSLLNLLPMVLLRSYPVLTAMMSPLFEITTGLARLPKNACAWAYIVLPFGGLSCIAQTYSCIQGTGLSIREYVLHKAVLTVLTAIWYQIAG